MFIKLFKVLSGPKSCYLLILRSLFTF